MNGHEANTEKKSTFSYEAQMIICILIIYPLAVHVMNEYFFLLLQPLFAWRHRKETCCFFNFFFYILFHMFMNWRWSNCFARARCSTNGDTIWTEKFPLWTVEGLWHKEIWWGICVTIVASKAKNEIMSSKLNSCATLSAQQMWNFWWMLHEKCQGFLWSFWTQYERYCWMNHPKERKLVI